MPKLVHYNTRFSFLPSGVALLHRATIRNQLLRRCRRRRSFTQVTRKPLARAHDAILDDVFFSRTNTTLYSGTGPRHGVGHVPGIEGGGSDGDRKPPDERVIKLGKSMLIYQNCDKRVFKGI